MRLFSWMALAGLVLALGGTTTGCSGSGDGIPKVQNPDTRLQPAAPAGVGKPVQQKTGAQ